ncbi:NAD(P)H-binding protein [Paenibacillus sp. LHD-117]|uniref:NAD(P)H-binding protein n=1 Tax=Paenibacillus sp. LHD-117 TaxID=3071412 RepID=UPI0027E0A6BC|nr:NAD(P)H-binding protein [Paenibacillus sp. LHD-117]MDQ6422221.1 NAD(P)H-binding protein [Paenibacillus sp. LHD-117]
MGRRAIIAGATGLVGGELVKLLLGQKGYDGITVLVRRRINIAHPRLTQLVVDYEQLGALPAELFTGADVYCALGTTMKKAGSKANFERVDYHYPMELAKLAKRAGAEKLLVVTAAGADTGSMFFYSKVKGRLETDLQSLSFRSLHLFRPSLILGDRSEFRLGERVASRLMGSGSFLFAGPARKYKPVRAEIIAQAMASVALATRDIPTVIPSHELEPMAAMLRK